MAYNKRNWKARQGTGLNFFSIDGATPVPIVNQPTTLTEAGDALSAGNLNDWEQRIADGFDSASGELADAVEELESEDTALRSAINANSNRIANLEQKAGDYSIVQYRGTNAVPTGKAKYGLVEKIVGKSRAWNQLVYNGNFASTSGWESSGATISASNNVLSLTASAQGGYVRLSSSNAVRFNKGDVLLATFIIKGTSSTTIQYTCQQNNYIFNESVSVTTSWKQVVLRSDLTGGDASGFIFFFDNRESGWDTIYIKEVCIYDLTLIFGSGNEPSTVSDALTALPALGQYNAYDTGSLVSTTVEGVESVSRNLFDNVWEEGYLNSGNGTVVYSGSYATTDFIPVLPSTLFYIKGTQSAYDSVNIAYYDNNKNFLRFDGSVFGGLDTSFTTDAGAYYLRITITLSSTSKEGLCINKSDSLNGTFTPFFHDTLSLPSVTLRSDDEYTPETGGIVRKMVQVDLSDYDWTYSNGYWYMTSGTKKDNFTNIVKGFGGSSVPNWVSAKYEIVKGSEVVLGDKLYAIGQSSDKGTICHNGSSTTPPSGALVVELATPTTESIDPIPDNTLYTEGGGTIDTIQEQSPVIDNCLDVGYLAV